MNLTLFCSADPKLPALTTPHVHHGWKYATDGRVVVRMPTNEPDTVRTDGHEFPLSKIVKIIEHCRAHGSALTPTEIPNLPEPNKIKCRFCGGMGRMEKCAKCAGNGFMTCGECGHTHRCEPCDHTGLVATDRPEADACDECGGSGEKTITVAVRVGPNLFSNIYLEKLLTLPGLLFYPDYPNPEDNRLFCNGMMGYFTFDGGGEGALMPMMASH